jgi:hypothetical protein
MPQENYGKNLFEKESLQEILDRLEKLTPQTKNEWGKMSVDQMLVHVSRTLETAMGIRNPKRGFLGYTLGPLFKKFYLNEEPLRKNSPTDPSFVVADAQNFTEAKAKLQKLLVEFNEGGPEKVTKNAHSFFGKLTPAQWARGQYKHFDHHFRQFGV